MRPARRPVAGDRPRPSRDGVRHPHEATYDPDRGGSPRLALEKESYLEGERQSLWYLEGDLATIGSDAGCDVVLPGLEPLHACVRHDDADEFTITSDGPEVRVHGQVVRAQLLRSGARIELGTHVLGIKDMAGLCRPRSAWRLVKALREEIARWRSYTDAMDLVINAR